VKWFRVRVLITIDLKVLAPDRDSAKNLAMEELTGEVMSDGAELIDAKYKVVEVKEG